MTFRKRILSAVMCLCLLYTAVPLRAKATAAGSTQADERVSGASITAWKTGATSFNINGRNSSGEYQTTYRDRGYQTVACVDGGTKQKNPSNLIASGLRLDVDIETENDNYIKVRYTLTNSGVGSHTVNVGSHADVMIDNNDKAPIWAEVSGGNTLNMSGSPKNDYAFKLVATSCDTLWYGIFYESYRNCFTDMTDRGPENMFTKDSGLAYSWNATVAPGEIWTSCVLIGTGSNNEMAIEAPVIPEPEVVIPDPSIELVSNEVYYTEEETLPEQAEWRGLRFVKSYKGNLTVTGIPSDSNTIGVYTVTYKAENSKGTATAELKVNILPKPAALSQAAVTGTGNFTLSAKMEYTGGLNYTETGFVYGVISKPTLAKNDGKVKTSKAVGSKGGALSASVAKSSLAVGLQYYARAYAKASDGSVIYGASSTAFGVGVPAYGTFSVKNNKNNTFTISRTGGTEGKQTVYYRTVNGSAVGGTHFNHTYGTVTFAAGSSANQTVTVTEYGVDKVYKSWGGTAYSNADRTYQLEIYRVEGGAAVKTVKATRTMVKNSSYSIDRNIYGTEKSIVNIKKTNSGKNGKRIADAKKAQGATNTNVNFMLNRYGAANYNTSTSLSDYYSGNILSYIKSTCSQWLYRYEMYAYEEEDGWEHAYIGTKQLENAFYEVGSGDAVSLINGQLWACTFQQGQGDNQNLYKFPSTKSGGGENSRIPTNWNGAGNLAAPILTNNHRQSDSYYVRPGVNDNCHLHFSASGGGEDIWWINGLTSYALPYDNREPQLVGVAPMAGGKYLKGDIVTFSLIFDEIVDSANSSLSSSSVITTSWGTFNYAGGADTNVLYFTGTVPENAASPIKLTKIDCSSQIKDMSSDTGTEHIETGTKSANVSVGTAAAPTVSVTSLTNSNGALTGKITAANAVKLEYAWSTSKTLPTSGWTVAGRTSSATVKTARNSGTYYLHARATNSDGLTVTAYKSVTVPSSGTGAASSLELMVSTDNTAWAKKRSINITRMPTDVNVKVTKPDGSTQIIGSSGIGFTYTATANGVYTFTLTHNGETMVRQAVVSRIDTTAPTITINDLDRSSYTERVRLTFSVADGGSGVNTVTAKWGTADAAVTDNGDGTYSTVCPNSTGTHTLTVTATDNVGNSSASKKSKSYTVNLNAPTLTVTKKSTAANGVTYSYSVSPNGNSNVTVRLPDGAETTDLTDSFILTEAGSYMVVVTDAAGHFVSKEIEVTENVDGIAPDVRLYTDDTVDKASLDVEVGIYEAKALFAATKNGEKLSVTDLGGGEYTASFTVTKGGVYTVTAADAAGKQGTDSVTVYALTDGDSTVLKLAKDGKYDELPRLSRGGYAFDGWYTAASGGTKVTSGTAVGSIYTLYAHWTHIAHYGGEATCTEKAKCAVCGAEYGEIDSNNHDIIHHEAKAATCTEKGYNAYDTCSRCDYTTFEETSYGDHDYENGTWVTDENGHRKKCANCDSTDAPADHIFGEWVDGKRTCEVCGYEERQIISVTITWSEMSFTYTDGVWDPETHDCPIGEWKADSTDGNMITVENGGEGEVTVSFVYTQEDDSVAGSFADEQGADIETPVALPAGDKKYAWLNLNGKPKRDMNAETVGRVTVYLGGNK